MCILDQDIKSQILTGDCDKKKKKKDSETPGLEAASVRILLTASVRNPGSI